MAKLGELFTRKRVSPQKQAEAIATEIWERRIEAAAAKALLRDALKLIQGDADALPVLTVEQRIRTFLERHRT